MDRNGRTAPRSGTDAPSTRDLNDRLQRVVDSLRQGQDRRRELASRPSARERPSAKPAAAGPAPRPSARSAVAPRHGTAAAPRSADPSLVLRERVRALEEENLLLSRESATVMEQSTQLATLYAMLARLHGSLDHAEVLSAIEEVVVSFIGCEQFAIYETEPAKEALLLRRSMGLAPERLSPVLPGEGDLGELARRGQLFVAPDEGAARSGPRAFIPLLLGERPIGAIVLYELLGHKPTLSSADRELMELLSTHAASALCASRRVEHTT